MEKITIKCRFLNLIFILGIYSIFLFAPKLPFFIKILIFSAIIYFVRKWFYSVSFDSDKILKNNFFKKNQEYKYENIVSCKFTKGLRLNGGLLIKFSDKRSFSVEFFNLSPRHKIMIILLCNNVEFEYDHWDPNIKGDYLFAVKEVEKIKEREESTKTDCIL